MPFRVYKSAPRNRRTAPLRIPALFFGLVLFAGCSGTSAPGQALEEYIDAVKEGNFQTVYELNATTQKKVALIHRGAAAGIEESLKENYERYKEGFDTIRDDSGIGGLWAEKLLFPPDSRYSVTDIRIEEETGSPSARFKPRVVAVAGIDIEYVDKDSAPAIGGGKVKKVICEVLLIKGEDAVKGLRSNIPVREWLFKDIHVKSGEIIHW